MSKSVTFYVVDGGGEFKERGKVVLEGGELSVTDSKLEWVIRGSEPTEEWLSSLQAQYSGSRFRASGVHDDGRADGEEAGGKYGPGGRRPRDTLRS